MRSADLPAYEDLLRSLGALFSGERDLVADTANMAALLFQSLPEVSWAGFYFRRDQSLVLGPFQGPPACIRLPWGEGVCGRAALSGSSLRVADVHTFPGHIACDPAARSEIVVPVFRDGRVVGVLDLDSYVPDRFQLRDEEGLEAMVRLLESAVDWSPWVETSH
jgi:GAF domain-containing protein